ncbi:VOC family protein [Cellulomonas sp. JZ18]|uniref:VOC family protein n=1 Tax=Cellulomonas sp. JZ18 TaxID=2654191 RepID=UPI0012D4776B|nr:VOC family protein [Cellulomonas sp. JZ18]
MYLAADDVTLAVGHAVAAGAQLLAGPMTVLGLGDVAVLADPAGAVVGLHQPGAHTGWDVTDEPGAFVWAEQMSHRPDLSRRFYTDLFGYEQTDMSAPDFTYTSLAVGGTPAVGVGGYGAGVGADVPAAWTWYVAVTDAEEAARRVPEVGGAVVSGPEDTPYGRLVLAQGPAGEVVALLEQAPPEVVA